jgi:hypothetical protein
MATSPGLKRKSSRKRASDISPNIRLAAHLLEILLRNDRQTRSVCAPRNRREWGITRLNDYLHAIGVEIASSGDAALWGALRDIVGLLPQRREEGLARLIRLWAHIGDWLSDQAIARPPLPHGYDRLSAPRVYSTYDDPPAA